MSDLWTARRKTRPDKIEKLEIVNTSLREKDKTKDEIISSLSDRLIALSERIEVLEKR